MLIKVGNTQIILHYLSYQDCSIYKLQTRQQANYLSLSLILKRLNLVVVFFLKIIICVNRGLIKSKVYEKAFSFNEVFVFIIFIVSSHMPKRLSSQILKQMAK